MRNQRAHHLLIEDYGENETSGKSHRKSSVGLWFEQEMALTGFWANVWYWVVALFLRHSWEFWEMQPHWKKPVPGTWSWKLYLVPSPSLCSASCLPGGEQPPFLHIPTTRMLCPSIGPSKPGFKSSETRRQIERFLFQEVSNRYFVTMMRKVIKTGRICYFCASGQRLDCLK